MFTIVVKFVLVALAFILCTPDPCRGWDQAELDLFDLVEEVGENFYNILHVEQVSEIRSEFLIAGPHPAPRGRCVGGDRLMNMEIDRYDGQILRSH
jgi:hypothetical protein